MTLLENLYKFLFPTEYAKRLMWEKIENKISKLFETSLGNNIKYSFEDDELELLATKSSNYVYKRNDPYWGRLGVEYSFMFGEFEAYCIVFTTSNKRHEYQFDKYDGVYWEIRGQKMDICPCCQKCKCTTKYHKLGYGWLLLDDVNDASTFPEQLRLIEEACVEVINSFDRCETLNSK